MHYIFLIFLVQLKFLSFKVLIQILSLKEIIIITKTYPIITIDITQIIDNTFDQNLSFSILNYKPNWTKWTKVN